MERNGVSDAGEELLVQNLFAAESDYYADFFGRYGWNRYLQNPDVQMPDHVKDIAAQKLSAIYAVDGIAMCAERGVSGLFPV